MPKEGTMAPSLVVISLFTALGGQAQAFEPHYPAIAGAPDISPVPELVSLHATVSRLTQRRLMIPMATGSEPPLDSSLAGCTSRASADSLEWVVGPYSEGWGYQVEFEGCAILGDEDARGTLFYTVDSLAKLAPPGKVEAAPPFGLRFDPDVRTRAAAARAAEELADGYAEIQFELDVVTGSGTRILAQGEVYGDHDAYGTWVQMSAVRTRGLLADVAMGGRFLRGDSFVVAQPIGKDTETVEAEWEGEVYLSRRRGATLYRGVLHALESSFDHPIDYGLVRRRDREVLPSRGCVAWGEDKEVDELCFLPMTPLTGIVSLHTSDGEDHRIRIPRL